MIWKHSSISTKCFQSIARRSLKLEIHGTTAESQSMKLEHVAFFSVFIWLCHPMRNDSSKKILPVTCCLPITIEIIGEEKKKYIIILANGKHWTELLTFNSENNGFVAAKIIVHNFHMQTHFVIIFLTPWVVILPAYKLIHTENTVRIFFKVISEMLPDGRQSLCGIYLLLFHKEIRN